MEWAINSSCESIHIISTLFQTESSLDIVTIEGIEYSGSATVNQIVATNVLVRFSSDAANSYQGFILSWHCTQWGEWNPLFDGTCRTHVRRPISNGRTTIGDIKTKSMSPCCKL